MKIKHIRIALPALLSSALCIPSSASAAELPAGFTPLFDGRDLDGWHVSEVNHHGNTKAWTVKDGVLMVTQDPPGNGGILLTNKKYRDFEVSLEIRPDWGCDGGLFLRSNEKGEAYQVLLDYLEGGIIGGIYGERLPEVNQSEGTGRKVDREWQRYWKKDAWNLVRARIEGDVPHIQVWLNGHQLVDWTDSANHAAGGATEGMIALQAHRSNPKAKNPRWVPGGYHRYRNIGIKELTRK
ncbi:MAG: DUF1080 domain-containing protein [Acidobacteria bacterium]|nr:DUF1080 domain-containing protein [Acidobacteriota bacterium]MBI3279246.1 DUF1080 domain-containing protein [Acidobacteriota bacterium]